nr:hypothetical protein [Moritella viscosa]SHO03658.1 Putative uncharacterized protein [Moritella viscosa]
MDTSKLDNLADMRVRQSIHERKEELKQAALAKFELEKPKPVVKVTHKHKFNDDKAVVRPPANKKDESGTLEHFLANGGFSRGVRTQYDQSNMKQTPDDKLQWKDTSNNFTHLF